MFDFPASMEAEELERGIRRRLDRRDHGGAATLALRGYGAEIFGFLVAFHHDQDDAAGVVSDDA